MFNYFNFIIKPAIPIFAFCKLHSYRANCYNPSNCTNNQSMNLQSICKHSIYPLNSISAYSLYTLQILKLKNGRNLLRQFLYATIVFLYNLRYLIVLLPSHYEVSEHNFILSNFKFILMIWIFTVNFLVYDLIILVVVAILLQKQST